MLLIKENELDFYTFVQDLINSKTPKELTLKLTVSENYYEVPTEFTELSDLEYAKVFREEPFKTQLTNKIKSININETYKFMKDNLDLFINLGTIAINYQSLCNTELNYHNYDSLIRT